MKNSRKIAKDSIEINQKNTDENNIRIMGQSTIHLNESVDNIDLDNSNQTSNFENTKLQKVLNYDLDQNDKFEKVQTHVKLHKICVKNFKSFEGEHEIGFFKNFSVVLGPNGSGKSNIIDAICFALGMKTASLRCKNLKELIYKLNTEFTEENKETEEEEEKECLKHKKKQIKNKEILSASLSIQRDCYVELYFLAPNNIDFNKSQGNLLNFISKEKEKNKKEKEKEKKKNSFINDSDEENLTILKFKRVITFRGNSEFFFEDKKLSAEEYNKKLEILNIPSSARYFILVQGAIDTLLSKKNDLSEIIECLSGSIKYKGQYEELKRKLEEISIELNKKSIEKDNLKTDQSKLKLQINNEEKYNQLLNELNHYLEKIFLLRIAQEDLNLKKNLLNLEQNDQSVEEIEKAKIEKMALLKQKNTDLSKMESSNKDDEESGKLWKIYQEINANFISNKEKLKLYSAQIFGKISVINQKKIEIDKNKEKFRNLEKEQENIFEIINDLKARIELEDPTKKLSKDQIKEFQNLSNEFDKQAYKTKKEILEKRNKINELLNQINLLEKTEENLKIEIENLNKEIYKKKLSEQEEIKLYSELNENIQKIEEKMRDKNDDFKTNQANYNAKRIELDDLIKRLSCYDQSTFENTKRKKILEYTRNNQKIYGFLFELISPIKKQMELPVKVALLKYLGYLIVFDNDTSKELSDHLKSQSISADVIVLENIPKIEFDENQRKLVGNLGSLVVDLIDCKKKEIREAINFFVKDFVLCYDPKVENVNYLRQKGFNNIITMDGTLYKKGSILSGNYRNLEQYSFNYKIGNFEEITKMRKDQEKLEKEIAELGLKINDNSELNSFSFKLDQYKNSLDTCRRMQGNLRNDIEKAEKEREIKKKNLENLNYNEKNLKNVKKEIEIVESDLISCEENEREIKEKIFSEFLKKNKILNLDPFEKYSIEEIKRFSFELKEKEEKIHKILNQINSIKSHENLLKSLEDSLNSDKSTEKKIKEEIENISENMDKSLKNYEDHYSKKNKNFDQIKSLQGEISRINSELDTIDKRNHLLYKNQLEYEHNLKKLMDNKHSILQESKNNLETFFTELEISQNNIFISFNPHLDSHLAGTNKILEKQNLIFNYDLLEASQKFSIESEDFSYTDMKLKKLKTKFKEKLINLNEYVKFINLVDEEEEKLRDKEDQLKEKKKEINLEMQKLIKESDNLKDEFTHIKEQRIIIFNKFFEKLSIKISENYKILTKPINSNLLGGNVYIHKTDKDEPYLGDVCYLPTPPGKRSIHDIDLLSGGEKTIAILSLLISLQSICFTPLLVFDEIDCYLDPNHELVLERLFKEKQKEFQIIIVTHKSNIFRSAQSLLGTYFNKFNKTSVPISLNLEQFNQRKKDD